MAVQDVQQTLVRAPAEVAAGDPLRIRLAEGELHAVVAAQPDAVRVATS